MVLLENEGVLPLDPSKRTAVIGPLGDDQHDVLGPWWGRGADADAVSLLTGIRAQSPGATFAQGCAMIDRDPPDLTPADECGSDAGFAEAVAAARAADQVVLALGETRGQSRRGRLAHADRPARPAAGAARRDQGDGQAVRGGAAPRQDVANTGSRAGDEVAQLYIGDPVASISQPVRRLRGFQRVTLEPGATTTVSFTLDRGDFGFYDKDGRLVVEPGTIDVYAGNSATAGLKRSFAVTG
jgi:hypothetical protein